MAKSEIERVNKANWIFRCLDRVFLRVSKGQGFPAWRSRVFFAGTRWAFAFILAIARDGGWTREETGDQWMMGYYPPRPGSDMHTFAFCEVLVKFWFPGEHC